MRRRQMESTYNLKVVSARYGAALVRDKIIYPGERGDAAALAFGVEIRVSFGTQ